MGWIFREQTIVDVGVDGIIETAKDLIPTGKFIGAQVKSGNSHFKGSGKELCLYITDVHKNYWCSMNIPIILVGYLPEEKLIFWSKISKRTIKKTPTKWKINVNKNQILGITSITKLTKLIDEFVYPNQTESNVSEQLDVSLFERLVQNVKLLKDSNLAVNNMSDLMQGMSSSLDIENEKLKVFIKDGKNENDLVVSKVLDSIGILLSSSSRKLKTEIQIFGATFGIGIGAYDQCYRLLYKLDQDSESFRKSKDSLHVMIESIEMAYTNIASIRTTLEKMRDKNSKIRLGKQELLNTLDKIVSEYKSAEEFCIALAN